MNEQTIDKVIEAVKPIAEKIGQGAEFLYGVYYRQTIVEGIMLIAIPILLMLVFGIVMKKWISFAGKKRKEWKETHGRYDDDGWFIAMLLTTLAYGILVFVSIFCIIQGGLQIANPHFYTIDRIISSVQNKQVQ